MFFIAFAIGISLHIFLDLMDGYVAILSPFTFERYSITGAIFGYTTNTIYPSVLNDTGYKAWNAFDLMSDTFAYLILWYWSTHKTKIPKE